MATRRTDRQRRVETDIKTENPEQSKDNPDDHAASSRNVRLTDFIEHSSVETGLCLMDRLLLAIKDGTEHQLGPIFKALRTGIPDELVTPGEKDLNPKAKDAAAFRLLTRAAEQLADRKLLVRVGPGDESEWSKETVVQLPAPEPDPHFEIDPEFQNLLPPPSESELAALEHQILTEGCRKPLTTWKWDGRTFLVNGHTRLKICQRHGKEYNLDETVQPSRAAVIDWIWFEHLGQRNFHRLAASYARGRRFIAMKLQHGGDRREEGAKSQNATLKKAAIVVAKALGINRATLFRDAKFAEALDQLAEVSGRNEIRTTVLSGAIRLAVKEVQELASKDRDEVRRVVESLLTDGKASLGGARGKKRTEFLLPMSNPKKQAQTLLGKLGRSRASKLIEELQQLLQDSSASEP